MLVVGIGYRMGGIDETNVVRTRDFTPDLRPRASIAVFPALHDDGRRRAVPGVHPRRAAAVGARALPRRRRRRHVLRALAGRTVRAPTCCSPNRTTFRRYGIGSPSLWWDADMMFEYEAQYARDARRPPRAGVLRGRRVRGPRRPPARGEPALRRRTRRGRAALHRHGRRHRADGRGAAEPQLSEPRDREHGPARRVPHHRAAAQPVASLRYLFDAPAEALAPSSAPRRTPAAMSAPASDVGHRRSTRAERRDSTARPATGRSRSVSEPSSLASVGTVEIRARACRSEARCRSCQLLETRQRELRAIDHTNCRSGSRRSVATQPGRAACRRSGGIRRRRQTLCALGCGTVRLRILTSRSSSPRA